MHFLLKNVKIFETSNQTRKGFFMKKPTIKDIAGKAEVSTACVSMILNGKNISRFSEETIQKVYQASRDLGYVPKKQKLHKTKKLILIICPSLINPYYATLIQSMEQEARLKGFSSMLFTTYCDRESEREALELTGNPLIAGAIFAAMPQQPELAEEVGLRIPMVVVGDRDANINVDTVDVNNHQAGRMLASHLIRLGHKHIAFISSTLNQKHPSRMNRLRGLQDEYLVSCPAGTVTVYAENISSEQELQTIDVEHQIGYKLTRLCLDNSPQVTAIVSVNDMVGYGVREALIEAGRRIPEDISLCGFDNIYPSRFLELDMTTIELASIERGRASVRLLTQKIREMTESGQTGAIKRLEYRSKLIAGKTSGPAPA